MFGVGDRRSSVLSDQDALETIASGLESYTSQQAELQQAGSAAFPGDAAAKQQQAELAASLGTTPSADPELWVSEEP